MGEAAVEEEVMNEGGGGEIEGECKLMVQEEDDLAVEEEDAAAVEMAVATVPTPLTPAPSVRSPSHADGEAT